VDRPLPDTYPAGLRAGVPLIVPTLLIGSTFGLAASTAGWGDLAPVLMSVIVFAGGAQFATLSVLEAGGGVLTAIVAATLINLRFLALGVAIGPSLRGGRLRRAAEGWTITDASIILARTGEGRYGARRLVGSFVPQFLGWTLGTLGGVLAGSRLEDPGALGLDALYPAFFLALLWGEIRERGPRATAIAVAATAVARGPPRRSPSC